MKIAFLDIVSRVLEAVKITLINYIINVFVFFCIFNKNNLLTERSNAALKKKILKITKIILSDKSKKNIIIKTDVTTQNN